MNALVPSFVFDPFLSIDNPISLAKPPKFMAYKSAEEKLGYQKSIPSRIRPYLMGYIASIQPEIETRVEEESPEEYLLNLKLSWQRHNEVNEAIDMFLFHQEISLFKDWSLEEWRLAKDLLRGAVETDHVKNIYSGGLKRKIEYEARKLEKKLNLTQEEKGLLLTPSLGTFMEVYFIEHGKYWLSMIEKDVNKQGRLKLKHKLISSYHCDDEELLKLRMATLNFSKYDPEELNKVIINLENKMGESRIKKLYFILDRNRAIRIIDQLLVYDNLHEYVWIYNFKGFPDVFLREEIVRRLKLANKISPEIDALQISPHQLLNLVDSHIKHRGHRYLIRLHPYFQNDGTCGTCCVMSVLAKKGIPLNIETEYTIWGRVGKPYNFPGGMAKVLMENSFAVHYYQYPAEPFTPNHEDVLSGDSFLAQKIEEYVSMHHEAVAIGMNVSISDWNSQKVREELEIGNPCIVGIQLTPKVLHWVTVRGYRGGRFEVVDPLRMYNHFHVPELDSLIETSMGKRMLVVEKLPRDFFTIFNNALARVGIA